MGDFHPPVFQIEIVMARAIRRLHQGKRKVRFEFESRPQFCGWKLLLLRGFGGFVAASPDRPLFAVPDLRSSGGRPSRAPEHLISAQPSR
jgi:hypothetical protein